MSCSGVRVGRSEAGFMFFRLPWAHHHDPDAQLVVPSRTVKRSVTPVPLEKPSERERERGGALCAPSVTRGRASLSQLAALVSVAGCSCFLRSILRLRHAGPHTLAS